MWLLIEPQSEKAHTEDVSRRVLHASRFPNIKAVKRASNDHGTDAGTHAETIHVLERSELRREQGSAGRTVGGGKERYGDALARPPWLMADPYASS